MTEQYQSIGLPIWLVDSYDEVREVNEQSLEGKYRELSLGFGTERMWADYWITLIKNQRYGITTH
jgi:hypothetical protein